VKLLDHNRIYREDGSCRIDDDLYSELRKLAEIVLNTHYANANPSDKDDLVSVGVLKGLELIVKGQFDANRASLKNYVYTGMRNEMTNYLYRNKKEIVLEEFYGFYSTDRVEEDAFFKLDYQFVCDFLNRVERPGKVNDYIKFAVVEGLKDIGFLVEGDTICDSFCLNSLPDKENMIYKADKLVVMFIWEQKEFFLS